jgi:uncharacterized protein YecT (DUF1311 family)
MNRFLIGIFLSLFALGAHADGALTSEETQDVPLIDSCTEGSDLCVYRCLSGGDIDQPFGACIVEQQAVAEAALKRAYNDVLNLSQKSERRAALKLSAAQRAWVLYRAKNCDYRESVTRTNDGHDHKVCMLEMTRLRVRELRELRMSLSF